MFSLEKYHDDLVSPKINTGVVFGHDTANILCSMRTVDLEISNIVLM